MTSFFCVYTVAMDNLIHYIITCTCTYVHIATRNYINIPLLQLLYPIFYIYVHMYIVLHLYNSLLRPKISLYVYIILYLPYTFVCVSTCMYNTYVYQYLSYMIGISYYVYLTMYILLCI
jgi:hypothetical protein